MDVDDTLYGEDRLRETLASTSFGSVEESVQVSVSDVWAFQGEAEQADDVTVLGVLYQGQVEVGGGARLELTIANRLEEIQRVNAAIEAFAEESHLDDSVRRQLSLVFDELLNNIISYGYADDLEHEIELVAHVHERRLLVTIIDDGIPFNPLELGEPDTTLSVEDRPIGGLGLHLVQSMMDQVSYERRGAHNVVLLEKQLEPIEE